MIERLIDWSIRRRLLVLLAALGLACWGAWALVHTPVDAIPDLSEDQVIVYANWPGHSPADVDAQVAYPLSIALRGVTGVRTIRASSEVGYAWLAVILEESAAYESTRRTLAERLANLPQALPAGVSARLAPDTAATGQIFWYTIEGGGLDPGQLRTLQDNLVKGQLAAVPGVAEVGSIGGWPEEFEVALDPAKLRAQGLAARDVREAVASSEAVAGAHVLLKAGAEYLVRGPVLRDGAARLDPAQVVAELGLLPLRRPGGGTITLGQVATPALAAGPRRGSLEKDGAEAVGGVVLLAHGANPREVTRRLKQKIVELGPALPAGVRIVPFYDRTPLIDGALRTVSGTVVEAMLTSALCVLLVLLHLRASLIIAITLPLAALASFACLWFLRTTGLADVQTNIMSLAGIAISIGVLVDSSIVVTENAMQRLRQRFGEAPVRGDIRPIIAGACQEVGRPVFFSVLIMLLSFLPVFSLGGMEGKMFRPLAATKCLALAAVALLAVTLVPALCSYLLRGRMRSERDSAIVRGVIDVYRPILSYLLDRPAPLAWVLGATLLLASAAVGVSWLLRVVLAGAMLSFGLLARHSVARLAGVALLLVLGLLAQRFVHPLEREFLTPLDEGMVMDMPITVPRASIVESTADLRARDMILCRFPEVAMVVGKAGRADTPSDPAPLDMIETMVELRPREHWPRRQMTARDARRHALTVVRLLADRGLIDRPQDQVGLVDAVMARVAPRLDVQLREYCYQRFRELPTPPAGGGDTTQRRAWNDLVARVDAELPSRAAEVHTRLLVETIILEAPARDSALVRYVQTLNQERAQRERTGHHHAGVSGLAMSRNPEVAPELQPPPILDEIQAELAEPFARSLVLWKKERNELLGFGGELDRAVSMPGWTNVWTMPIQNRVDMLATGVNTTLGVRVLGRTTDDVVQASDAIAAVLKAIPGAADVVADPIRGKGVVDVQLDRTRAAARGVSAADAADAIELAVGGQVATTIASGRDRIPVRVRYARDFREDEEDLGRVLVPTVDRSALVPLAEVAVVRVGEGLATVKSENGLPRNFIRLNVRGRPLTEFLDEARRTVAARVTLPPGCIVEWTGQFEHEARARATLAWVVPLVLVMIVLVLRATYHDWTDAGLVLLTVPGALAGGVIFQWLLGERFSVTVWIGYIACFGMAAATGIVMLVYLRDALKRAGGMAGMTPERLREAVLDGAAHRLRPKLLTEGTTIISLAPLLWASGVGAEVIRPMAAPVLGGLLIADEVVDLLVPILFYHIRRRRLAAASPSDPRHLNPAQREAQPLDTSA